ncbi:hypothetical protein B0H11DRAFT_1963370 [Mycena galericulata]|nr:hypothetical protein B0H11DRAFT_1963370 [Mycena galericulata]
MVRTLVSVYQSHTALAVLALSDDVQRWQIFIFEFLTKSFHVNEAVVPRDTVEGLVTLPGWSGPLDVVDIAADDGGDSSYDDEYFSFNSQCNFIIQTIQRCPWMCSSVL